MIYELVKSNFIVSIADALPTPFPLPSGLLACGSSTLFQSQTRFLHLFHTGIPGLNGYGWLCFNRRRASYTFSTHERSHAALLVSCVSIADALPTPFPLRLQRLSHTLRHQFQSQMRFLHLFHVSACHLLISYS